MTVSTTLIAASTNRFPSAADTSPDSLIAFGSNNLLALWDVTVCNFPMLYVSSTLVYSVKGSERLWGLRNTAWAWRRRYLRAVYLERYFSDWRRTRSAVIVEKGRRKGKSTVDLERRSLKMFISGASSTKSKRIWEHWPLSAHSIAGLYLGPRIRRSNSGRPTRPKTMVRII